MKKLQKLINFCFCFKIYFFICEISFEWHELFRVLFIWVIFLRFRGAMDSVFGTGFPRRINRLRI